MNTLIKSTNKTIGAVVLTTSLLLSVSAQAEEKVDIQTLTSFMVEQNIQQVNQQLSQQLSRDIHFTVMMKLPETVNKESNGEILLTRAVVNNSSKTKNQLSGE